MRDEADFEVLLRLVGRLGGEQRAALGRALASASGGPWGRARGGRGVGLGRALASASGGPWRRPRAGLGVGLGRALASASGEPEAAVRLLEAAFAAAPRCPHCGAARLQRWGYASGLRRYRCAACRKTFNALTGTSLARLRKKACRLAYGEALAAGMSLARAAAHCGVAACTSRPASVGGTGSSRPRRRRRRRSLAWSRRARPSFAAPAKAPGDGAAPKHHSSGSRADGASGRASGASRPSRSRP